MMFSAVQNVVTASPWVIWLIYGLAGLSGMYLGPYLWNKGASRIKRHKAADRIKSYEKLYVAVNEMMIILGADGEINTRQDCVTNVMGALHDIDGGVYQREIE